MLLDGNGSLSPLAGRGWGEGHFYDSKPLILSFSPHSIMDVRDSNGTILKDGDSVTLIKDLKVKGTSVTLKRGQMCKNIRLTDDEDLIECNVDKVKGLVLRVEFLKKA